MFGRKGQGAMEYLMTYGWAILVVMVVGIAMWQLGIFNMGGTTVTATGFPKIKPQLAGTGLKADGTFVGTFTNGVGTKIYINDITVTDGTTNCQGGAPGSHGITGGSGSDYPDSHGAGEYDTGTDGFSVSAGENVLMALACPAAIGGEEGEVYSVDVSITYTAQIGDQTVTHRDSGSIRGPYE